MGADTPQISWVGEAQGMLRQPLRAGRDFCAADTVNCTAAHAGTSAIALVAHAAARRGGGGILGDTSTCARRAAAHNSQCCCWQLTWRTY